MQVTRVDEIWNSRVGGVDEKGVRTYLRAFRVITDDATVGQLQVLSCPVLPRRFDPYRDIAGDPTQPGGVNLYATVDPYGNIETDINSVPLPTVTVNYVDYGALAQSVEARQTDQPTVWEVVVTYSNRTDWPDLGDIDPLQRPAEIELTFEPYTRAVQQLQQIAPISGDPKSPPAGSLVVARCTNSAGDTFDPPIEVDDSRPVLTVRRFEASMNPGVAYLYKDAVNSDFFLGAEPFKWKVKGITAKRHFENGRFYWEVTYVFQFRPDGWRLQVLDQGMRVKGTDGKLTQILDKHGQPVTSPVPLDGAGGVLDLNANPPPLGRFIQFIAYREMPFGDLQLGL